MEKPKSKKSSYKKWKKPWIKRVDKECYSSKKERKWNMNNELVKHNKCSWMTYRNVCHKTNQLKTKFFSLNSFFREDQSNFMRKKHTLKVMMLLVYFINWLIELFWKIWVITQLKVTDSKTQMRLTGGKSQKLVAIRKIFREKKDQME